MKVHRACTEMYNAILSEMRSMGIPFFGTSARFISNTGCQPDSMTESRSSSNSGINDRSPDKITSEELTSLQRRILQVLVDLCKE